MAHSVSVSAEDALREMQAKSQAAAAKASAPKKVKRKQAAVSIDMEQYE